jgi:hypothetical protein
MKSDPIKSSNVENVGRPLVGLLTGNVDFYVFLPRRPTRGLPTFSSFLKGFD